MWTLRTAGAADAEFLFRVYAETRLEELAPTGWSSAQLENFLRMQFAAQDRHYRHYFPAAQFEIIHAWGADVGRFCIDRSDDALRLLDIALLTEYRRRGLGSALLRTLLAEATDSGRLVSLHVERNNPALGLYLRLGFVEVDEQGLYRQMQWKPSGRRVLWPEARAEATVASA